MFDQLPSVRRDAVARALAGLGRVQSIEPLSGGLSGSGVWRVQAGGRQAILKLERPPDGLNDPVRQYACMAIAAEVGVAPKLLFADAGAGVSLVARIEARPLPERPVLLAEAAGLLRRLHAAPVFPALVDFPDGVAQLISRLQGLDLIEAEALAPLLEAWPQLKDACGWGEDGLVASHNDPNPRNLIWDGERLWLIDWEAAFRNDPLVDLAIVANYWGSGAADADALLEIYLGAPPGRRARNRLAAMQRVCRVYYGVVLINSAIGWTPPPEARRLQAPALADISAAIGTGRITLADPADRFAYGAAMLNLVLAGGAQSG